MGRKPKTPPPQDRRFRCIGSATVHWFAWDKSEKRWQRKDKGAKRIQILSTWEG